VYSVKEGSVKRLKLDEENNSGSIITELKQQQSSESNIASFFKNGTCRKSLKLHDNENDQNLKESSAQNNLFQKKQLENVNLEDISSTSKTSDANSAGNKENTAVIVIDE
jgi:hypothetical protein